MFDFSELKQIHLEITNNCQASCPMCIRNHHGGVDNPWLTLSSWTLDQFKSIITHEVLDQIDELYFCGNYGDPLLNNDLLEMCAYASNYKPDMYIRIHTNGGIRNPKWWAKLAAVLPKRHMVIFGIDGLEDTNHLYRIGADFKKIMDNASSFINAGGNAEWAFIIFKHNEHQTSTVEALAKKMGFKNFTKKNSNRFMLAEKFPVLDKNGTVVSYLEPPSVNNVVFIDRNVIKNYKEIVKNSEINCIAARTKEIYIDAFGRVYPCCFIAMIPYNYWEANIEIAHIRQEVFDQYEQLISDFGGKDAIDANVKSVRDIIDSHEYQTLWTKYWTDPKLITCARTCGTNKISKPIDQFIEREQING